MASPASARGPRYVHRAEPLANVPGSRDVGGGVPATLQITAAALDEENITSEPTPADRRHLALRGMQGCEASGTNGIVGHTRELRVLARCLAQDDAADLVQDTWVAALTARTPPR